VENGADLVEVESFIYSKNSLQPTRWVLCVPERSPVRRLEDLEGKRVATEMVVFTRRVFAERRVNVDVEFSWGVTEAKAADGLVDAVVEVTETGSSLRANGLRIVEELLTSTPVLAANHQAWGDQWKQAKIRQIAVLVKGALDAENRVGIKMNVPRDKLDRVIALLPSITAPTVAPLYASPNLGGKEWFAIDTVIDELTVRELFPKLLESGAVGIIEYPLNKII
jgi:ATP phosphoribosyltransferase